MAPVSPSRQTFKPSPDSAWRSLDDEGLVLNLRTSDYYSLNQSGAFIWARLEKGACAEDIAKELCAEYNVSPAAAAKDIANLIRDLRRLELLNEA
jgi:hypothetical protein